MREAEKSKDADWDYVQVVVPDPEPPSTRLFMSTITVSPEMQILMNRFLNAENLNPLLGLQKKKLKQIQSQRVPQNCSKMRKCGEE